MDYEQKYKEIVEWARKNKAKLNGVPIEEVLPELRESEDERTRKEIIEFIRSQIEDGNSVGWDRWIAYLEKQKEQKPAEWSEEHIACIFEKVELAKIVREQGNDDLTNAVQSAMLELSKVENTEWSEEDRKMLDDCIMALSNWRDAVANYGHEVVPCQKLIDWLKSLRPSWKPTEEQIIAVEHAYNSFPNDCPTKTNLRHLYFDLKKLT